MKKFTFVATLGSLILGGSLILLNTASAECTFEWCDAVLPKNIGEKVIGKDNCGNYCSKHGIAVGNFCSTGMNLIDEKFTREGVWDLKCVEKSKDGNICILAQWVHK